VRRLREDRTQKWSDEIMENLVKTATERWKSGHHVRKSRSLPASAPYPDRPTLDKEAKETLEAQYRRGLQTKR